MGTPEPRPGTSELHSPLVGGVSIYGVTTGTLGVVLYAPPGKDHRLWGLTSRHVGGPDDGEIFQPSQADRPGEIPRRIGRVVNEKRRVDASFVGIEVPATPGEILDMPQLRGFASRERIVRIADTHQPLLCRAGRATVTAEGRVSCVNRKEQVHIEVVAPGTVPLSQATDSGSIWMTPDGEGVALHKRGRGHGTRAWGYALHWVVQRSGLRCDGLRLVEL